MNLNPVIKNILLIIGCSAALAACSKNISPTGSTATTYSGNQEQDTFTFVDNGVVFSNTTTFNNDGECVIAKTASGSLFSLYTFETTALPVRISLTNIPGPLDGTGIFKQALADSPGIVGGSSTVIEFIDSVQTNYFVDSAVINVSYANVSTIIGSYTLWMTVNFDTTHKTVSGTFKLYTAEIN